MSSPRIVYIAFDRFPAPKGAAVHIAAFSRALIEAFGSLELVTPAGEESTTHQNFIKIGTHSPAPQPAGPQLPDSLLERLVHHELPARGANLIERVLCFRSHLRAFWQTRTADILHIRSIYEGFPLMAAKGSLFQKLVFEVNGLPSIELKYHYPDAAEDRDLKAKLYAQEQACLEAADLLITVSQVTADLLATRGIDPRRIRVIPNGVEPEIFSFRPPAIRRGEEPMRLLYAGTLSSWQGVGIALEALQQLRRDLPARLTIVGHGRPKQLKLLREKAWELGVGDAIEVLAPVSQVELAGLHHSHHAVLAPLAPDDRNLVQGCCPIKVIEAMATGTPLIASDMPVVRALARNDVDALLVKPGSAKAIKDGLLRIAQEPGLAERLSTTAAARVREEFTWEISRRKLIEAYRELLEG